MCDGIPTAADEKRRTEDSRASHADLLTGELASEEHDSTIVLVYVCMHLCSCLNLEN